MILPDAVLVHKFLDNINISKQPKQLVRTTIWEYERHLKKILWLPINVSDIVQDEESIKIELSYHQDSLLQ